MILSACGGPIRAMAEFLYWSNVCAGQIYSPSNARAARTPALVKFPPCSHPPVGPRARQAAAGADFAELARVVLETERLAGRIADFRHVPSARPGPARPGMHGPPTFPGPALAPGPAQHFSCGPAAPHGSCPQARPGPVGMGPHPARDGRAGGVCPTRPAPGPFSSPLAPFLRVGIRPAVRCPGRYPR